MFLSKPFTQLALSYLMFDLPLTKSSQQRKTARHCRTPVKSNIVILILGCKQYYCVVTVLIRRHFRSLQTELWSYAAAQLGKF